MIQGEYREYTTPAYRLTLLLAGFFIENIKVYAKLYVYFDLENK